MNPRARTLLPLLLLVLPVSSAAQVTTVLGGIDVYRSEDVTREWLLQEHGERLHEVLGAFQSGDFSVIGPRLADLHRSARQRGDIVHLDIGMTTAFEADTNRVYLLLDVVDRRDSVARLGHFRAPPADTVQLRTQVLEAWSAYEKRAFELVQARELSPAAGADCGAHHCLLGFEHQELAPYREQFDAAARQHYTDLVRVVREDASEARRANALFVLAHVARRDDLLPVTYAALSDPGSHVRNNAFRILAQLVERDAQLDLPLDAVLRALDDPSSSVRNKAALVTSLVAARPEFRPAILAHGPVLLRLLRLEQANNHEPALRVLQTLSGESYAPRDYDAWEAWLSRAR